MIVLLPFLAGWFPAPARAVDRPVAQLRGQALELAKEALAQAGPLIRRDGPYTFQARRVDRSEKDARCWLVQMTIWFHQRVYYNGIDPICPDQEVYFPR